jgi:hypothetical protein
VTDLRVIAKNCKFGTLEEDMLRDGIVCGVSSEKGKERLFHDNKLALQSALSVCGASEESAIHLKDLHNEEATAAAVFKKSKGGEYRKQSTIRKKNSVKPVRSYEQKRARMFARTVYHIQLDATVQPGVHPPRTFPAALRDELKSLLERMESQGVIGKVDEPTEWVNSIVGAEKSNGNVKICLDTRDLNKAAKREYYQLPTIEELTTRVAGAKVFSKLDANSGYWQIPLELQNLQHTVRALLLSKDVIWNKKCTGTIPEKNLTTFQSYSRSRSGHR